MTLMEISSRRNDCVQVHFSLSKMTICGSRKRHLVSKAARGKRWRKSSSKVLIPRFVPCFDRMYRIHYSYLLIERCSFRNVEYLRHPLAFSIVRILINGYGKIMTDKTFGVSDRSIGNTVLPSNSELIVRITRWFNIIRVFYWFRMLLCLQYN